LLVLRKLYRQLKSIDSNICILPWKEADEQVPLNLDEQLSLEDLQLYFPRIQAIQQGETYGDVRICHTVKWETIALGLGNWFKDTGTGLWRKKLQQEITRTIGYLLYSTRAINTDMLAESFKTDHDIEICFRYQAITTGPGFIPDSEKVALHVVTCLQDLSKAKKVFHDVYHSKSTSFPFQVRMRFIPWVYKPTPTKLSQLMTLRRRQAAFLQTVIHVPSWEIVSLDKKPTDYVGPTLRELIMGLTSRKDKPGVNLFISIDNAFNNSGVHVFGFLPQVEQEARTTLTTLLPFLKHCHPTHTAALDSFFTIDAINRTKEWKWDPKLQEITSADDAYLTSIMDDDGNDGTYFGLDMSESIEVVMADIPEMEKAKVQRTYNQEEKDSVGTLTSSANRSLITGHILPARSEITPTRTDATSVNTSAEDTMSSFATQLDHLDKRFNALNASLETFQSTFYENMKKLLAPNHNPILSIPANTSPSVPQSSLGEDL
jgi:hypothetical protein